MSARGTSTIRTVSFHTLGCKLNQAESDALAALFAQRGYRIVPFRQAADLTVINTCTVTGEADAKSRQVIRRAVAASPGGRVVVVGCYPQVKSEEVAALEGVDLVLGTREKHRLPDLLDRLEGGKRDKPLVMISELGATETWDESPFIAAAARTRAFLKVQDGCNYTCSYCIVPLARGRGRSRPLESCLEEARQLVDRGYQEVVLSGINLGTWREGDRRFQDLLEQVSRVEGLQRIRISSIEPNLVTDEVVQLVAGRDNIAPHLHVPLQHAADRMLKAMRRPYRMDDYRQVVDRILAAVPEAAIGADVMVGFPGETEEDFGRLAHALTELPLAYHHIFRYSEREGTLAAGMGEQVAPVVRKERSAILHEISRERRRAYAEHFLGQTRWVHFEHPGENGTRVGLTDNYLRVKVPVNGTEGKPFQTVNLIRWDEPGLIGALAT
jgi:threonylcarbamoyladenosine tRNA methylthiotransferase MtaB